MEGLATLTTRPGLPRWPVFGGRCLVGTDGGGATATAGVGLEVGGGVNGLTGVGGVVVEGGTAGLGGLGGMTTETGTTGVTGFTTVGVGEGTGATAFW